MIFLLFYCKINTGELSMKYTIINDKKYNIITYSNFFNKLKGLMFKKEPIKNIYMFTNCSSIHTLFMKQNIDLCILDKNYKIIYSEENVTKNKLIIKNGYYTLEMPLNTAKYLKTGDKLKIYEYIK